MSQRERVADLENGTEKEKSELLSKKKGRGERFEKGEKSVRFSVHTASTRSPPRRYARSGAVTVSQSPREGGESDEGKKGRRILRENQLRRGSRVRRKN